MTFWAKLEQGQGSRILQNIQIDVSRYCHDVKQLLTNKSTNFTVCTNADVIAHINSY